MKKINVKTARANKINHSTEMVFILDRSGSMAGLESDTIGGFNAMIEKQKKQPGKAYVSTVLYDTLHPQILAKLQIFMKAKS